MRNKSMQRGCVLVNGVLRDLSAVPPVFLEQAKAEYRAKGLNVDLPGWWGLVRFRAWEIADNVSHPKTSEGDSDAALVA
jgi:hypothetical protein